MHAREECSCESEAPHLTDGFADALFDSMAGFVVTPPRSIVLGAFSTGSSEGVIR